MKTVEEEEKISLSVVVPVYNTARWVSECLDSILAQDAFDLEVICVDDGSTDESPEILRLYSEKDSRVKVITQENQGVSVARNAGIEAARGEYIWFVDSDDTINPETTKAIYQAVVNNEKPQVICFSSFHRYGDEDYQGPRNAKESTKKTISRLLGLHTGPDVLQLFLEEKKWWYYVWANLFRKDFLIEKHLRFLRNLYRNQDAEFMLRVYRDADTFLCIPDMVINHRVREGSNMDLLTREATPRDAINKFDLITAFYKTYADSEVLLQKVPLFKNRLMSHIYNCQKIYQALKDEKSRTEVDSYYKADQNLKALFDLLIRYPVKTGKNLIELANSEKKLKSGRYRHISKLPAPFKKIAKKLMGKG